MAFSLGGTIGIQNKTKSFGCSKNHSWGLFVLFKYDQMHQIDSHLVILVLAISSPFYFAGRQHQRKRSSGKKGIIFWLVTIFGTSSKGWLK